MLVKKESSFTLDKRPKIQVAFDDLCDLMQNFSGCFKSHTYSDDYIKRELMRDINATDYQLSLFKQKNHYLITKLEPFTIYKSFSQHLDASKQNIIKPVRDALKANQEQFNSLFKTPQDFGLKYIHKSFLNNCVLDKERLASEDIAKMYINSNQEELSFYSEITFYQAYKNYKPSIGWKFNDFTNECDLWQEKVQALKANYNFIIGL